MIENFRKNARQKVTSKQVYSIGKGRTRSEQALRGCWILLSTRSYLQKCLCIIFNQSGRLLQHSPDNADVCELERQSETTFKSYNNLTGFFWVMMSHFPENSLAMIFRLPGCLLIYSLHVPVTLELWARGFSFALSDPEPSRNSRKTNKQTT